MDARRGVYLLVFLGVSALVCGAAALLTHSLLARNGSQLPNIILVVLDTLRWDCTSLGGQTDNETPELAKLAAGGFVFVNAYSTHDSTIPSHFSMFSGLERLRSPVDKQARYDLQENSLVHHLKQLGYFTIGVSANGLLTRETKELNFLKPFGVYVNFWEERPMAWIREAAAYFGRVKEIVDRFDAPLTPRSARMLVAQSHDVIEVVDRMLEERTETPLFLFVNFMDAHDPYFPPEGFYDLEGESALPGFHSDFTKRPLPDWETIVKDEHELAALKEKIKYAYCPWACAADLSDAHVARYKQRYKGCIRYLDSQIGRLFEKLRSRGLLEDSIVIIAADHGEAFGEDGFLTHTLSNRYAYEATHRVPLIIVPGRSDFERTEEIREKVSIADIFPTLHELLGITYDTTAAQEDPENSFGRSLVPLMRGRVRPRPFNGQFTMKRLWEKEEEMDPELVERLRALGYLE